MPLALIIGTLFAFVPYLIAVWRPPKLKWVVTVALLARLAMLTVPVTLSSDIHRYAWEGKVLNAGFNPYRYAPDAPELTELRDANWEKVEHREVPSIYPPFLLLVFRAEGNFRLIFTAFDLVTLWFIVQLLRARGQNESLAVIWAWNPLVILEFAGNGHEMSMPICFFVAGLWALQRGRVELTAVAFAAASLSHLMALPITLAVMLAGRVKRASAWLLFVALLVFGFLPFADAGRDLLLGLVHFAGRWRFNGSLFELLVRWFDNNSARLVSDGIWILYERPKRIAAVIGAGVFAWTLWRRYAPSRAALAVAGALLLLSPTLHPWYVTWMVALVCLEFRVSWLAFSAFVIVSYVAKLTELQTGVWVDSAFVRWIEYAPFFALWLVDSIRHRQ